MATDRAEQIVIGPDPRRGAAHSGLGFLPKRSEARSLPIFGHSQNSGQDMFDLIFEELRRQAGINCDASIRRVGQDLA